MKSTLPSGVVLQTIAGMVSIANRGLGHRVYRRKPVETTILAMSRKQFRLVRQRLMGESA